MSWSSSDLTTYDFAGSGLTGFLGTQTIQAYEMDQYFQQHQLATDELQRQIYTDAGQKVNIMRLPNINGSINIDPNTNTITVMNSSGVDDIVIELIVNSEKNPTGIKVNGMYNNIKEIDPQEQHNLSDNSVHYGTGADDLKKLI